MNELFLSCRFRAHREGPYNEYVYTFFKCLSVERMAYCEGHYASRRRAERRDVPLRRLPRAEALPAPARRPRALRDGRATACSSARCTTGGSSSRPAAASRRTTTSTGCAPSGSPSDGTVADAHRPPRAHRAALQLLAHDARGAGGDGTRARARRALHHRARRALARRRARRRVAAARLPADPRASSSPPTSGTCSCSVRCASRCGSGYSLAELVEECEQSDTALVLPAPAAPATRGSGRSRAGGCRRLPAEIVALPQWEVVHAIEVASTQTTALEHTLTAAALAVAPRPGGRRERRPRPGPRRHLRHRDRPGRAHRRGARRRDPRRPRPPARHRPACPPATLVPPRADDPRRRNRTSASDGLVNRDRGFGQCLGDGDAGGSHDGEVIAASLADPDRFTEIFERHFDAIYAFTARRLGPGAGRRRRRDRVRRGVLGPDPLRRSTGPTRGRGSTGSRRTSIHRHRRTETRRLRAYARVGAADRTASRSTSTSGSTPTAMGPQLAAALARARRAATATRCCSTPGPSSRTTTSRSRPTSPSAPSGRASTARATGCAPISACADPVTVSHSMSDLDLTTSICCATGRPKPSHRPPRCGPHALAQLEQQYAGASVTPTPHTGRGRRFGKRFAIAAVGRDRARSPAAIVCGPTRRSTTGSTRSRRSPCRTDVLGGGEIGKDPVNILVVGSDRARRRATRRVRHAGRDRAAAVRHDDPPPHRRAVGARRCGSRATSSSGRARRADQLDVQPRARRPDRRDQARARRRRSTTTSRSTSAASHGSSTSSAASAIYVAGPRRATRTAGSTSPARVRRRSTARRRSQWVRSRHLEIVQNGVVDATPARAPTSTGRRASRSSCGRSRAGRKAEVGGDPVAAVRLADAIIPALTIDSGFGQRRDPRSRARAGRRRSGDAAARDGARCEPAPDGARLVLDAARRRRRRSRRSGATGAVVGRAGAGRPSVPTAPAADRPAWKPDAGVRLRSRASAARRSQGDDHG